MRLHLIAFALLATTFGLPSIATADVIDHFTMVGGGNTFEFSIPADPILVVDHPHGVYFSISSPTATVNGVPGYISAQFQVSSLFVLPSLIMYVSGFGTFALAAEYPLNVAVVPVADPSFGHPDDLLVSFKPGTYGALANYPNDLGAIPYGTHFTFTITQEGAPAAATPEPGTLALLATSFVAGAGLLRRRSM